jgi:hypothetical protein
VISIRVPVYPMMHGVGQEADPLDSVFKRVSWAMPERRMYFYAEAMLLSVFIVSYN